MFSLSEEQIAFIEADIIVRGIKSPDLHIDLLDHICCIIEQENNEKDDFQEIYKRTISMFGSDGLEEIQKETDRLLTFKHYYIMNSTMKISGYVSAALILLGTLFKFYHWPAGSLLLMLGMAALSICFLPLMFILKFKSEQESNRSITLSLIGGGAAMFIATGILFKMMHWPGATAIQYTGFAMLIMAYLPIYLFSANKKASNKINAVSTVVLIIAGVSLLFAANNAGISEQTKDKLYDISEDLENTNTFMEHENQLLYQKVIQKTASDSALANIAIQNIHEKTVKVLSLLKDTKLGLIAFAHNIEPKEAITVKMVDIKEPGNYDFPTRYLFNKESPKIISVKKELLEYVSLINKSYPEIKTPFNLNDSESIDDELVTWEVKNFDHTPLSLVLYKLTQLEVDIKVMEASVYRSYIFKS